MPYLFSATAATRAKVYKLGKEATARIGGGGGPVLGRDACRSCQHQEEHVGLMTRQRWPGKPDPFPQGMRPA